MMARQTAGTNNFVKGLTDVYLTQDMSYVEVCENMCLDSDMTAIQRPGSAYQPGVSTDSKNASQSTVSGLSEHNKIIVATDSQNAYYKDLKAAPADYNPATNNPSLALNHNYPDDSEFTTPHLGNNPITPSTATPQPPDLSVLGDVVFHEELPDSVILTSQADGAIPMRAALFSSNDGTYNMLNPSFTDRFSYYSVGLPRFPDIIQIASDGLVSIYDRFDTSGTFADFGYLRIAGTTGGVDASNEGMYYDAPNTTNAQFTSAIVAGLVPYYYFGSAHNPAHSTSRGICFTFYHKYKIGDKLYFKESTASKPFYLWANREPFGVQQVPLFNVPINFNLNLNGSEIASYVKSFGYTLLEDATVGLNSPTIQNVPYGFGVLMYMTENNGTVFYRQTVGAYNKTGEIEKISCYQPQTFYTDTALYTTGGVLQNEPPPAAKYVHQAEAFTYYGHALQWTPLPESLDDANTDLEALNPSFKSASTGAGINWAYLWPGQYRLNYKKFIFQSVGNDPDSVPGSAYVEFPNEVQGIGSAGTRVVVGTSKAVYRIDGRYDEVGGGLVTAELLSTETGVISHRSMVSVGRRCIFLGVDGVYFTDGVDVVKISQHITQFYRSLISTFITDSKGIYLERDFEVLQSRIDGYHDLENDRVIWTFGDRCLILEVKASDLSNGFGSFWGPWLYGKNDGSKKYQCISSYNNSYAIGDASGYVRMVSSGYMTDPRNLNDATASSTWGVWPILYRLRSIKSSLTSTTVKKWVSHLNVVFKRRKVFNTGSEETLDVSIHSYNDGERVRSILKPVHYTGSADLIHDASIATLMGNVTKVITDTLINVQRRFTAPGLRCITKAVEFVNGMHLVGKSDDYELTLSAGSSVSLPNYPTYSWPFEVQDTDGKFYVITFESQAYAYKYVVTGYDPATLTVDLTPMGESAPIAVPVTDKWKLYSFSTKQFFGISNMGMTFEAFSSEQNPYHISDQGGNSGDRGE